MFRIEITGNNRTVNYTDKKNHAASFTVQEAYAHLPGAKYPARIEVMPPKGGAPYIPGDYGFDATSIYVDQHNKLSLSLKLHPLKRA